jgi:hypothetical protein
MKIISFTIALWFLSPTFSLAQSQNAAALKILQKAGAAITTLVQSNWRLTPEFLRMGFHDCVGGCDGTLNPLKPYFNKLGYLTKKLYLKDVLTWRIPTTTVLHRPSPHSPPWLQSMKIRLLG